ncbi:hypothetical protein HOE22_09800 [Candidatus Woesearchaeota archaeon]|nr:hypothetical protein [Candidatus Woesearchaeota archaeon]MBT4731270.1 hypothetical protein [Candidatus Woesearchaeota archaeon]MBT7558432.1 hypothetical protein [Candidatus Woesearchaeota archaeon]
MGRIKKHITVDEKKQAQRKWSLDYYHRNKDEINKEKMEKYYEEKIREFQKKLSDLRKGDYL